MKKRKITGLLLALSLGVIAACSVQAQEVESESVSEAVAAETETGIAVAEGEGISLKDMTGAEISLEKPAEKVVALSAADCEILYALNAGDTLVGRGEYCNYPDTVETVPAVQSGTDTNIEQIIALEPQIVLMSKMAQTQEQIAALENAGIKVVVSDAQDIDGVYTAISMIGTLVGKDSEAVALIAQMQGAFEQITTEAGDAFTGKTIYFEVSPLEYGLWTAGSDTFMDEIAQMLGLTNAFADVEGWGEISEEQVLERDPDYMVTITMYAGEGPEPEEEIMSRNGWSDLKAVKNQDVFLLDSDSLSRPGPRLADAAGELYHRIAEN